MQKLDSGREVVRIDLTNEITSKIQRNNERL